MELFWALLSLTVIVTVARYPVVKRHLGATPAIVVSLLRLLTLALAALLASPLAISGHRSVAQPTRVAVLVDVSESTASPERATTVAKLLDAFKPHRAAVLAWQFAEKVTPLDWEALPQAPQGKASRLSFALQQVVTSAQPQVLLLVTDGQDTHPLPDEQLVAALRNANTRLFALLLPSRLPPNLKVSVSPTRTFLFAGEQASFTVRVEGQFVPDKTPVTVRVVKGTQVIAQARAKLERGAALLTIPLRPDRAGWNRYRFVVAPLRDEEWTADNASEAAVWQAPTKLRVLLATGAPHFDFKFTKQALEEEPNIEWVAMADLPDGTRYQQGAPDLLPASLQRLEAFHTVVVLSPTPDAFGRVEGQAVWQFVQKGGGLVLFVGEQSVRSAGWQLFVPLPLALSSQSSPTPLTVIRNDLLGALLPDLPPAPTAWAVRMTVRPMSVAVKSRDNPVLVWWQEGEGKVVFGGMEGLWRWAMEAAQKGEAPHIYRQFWRTLVRFVANPVKGAERELTKEPTLDMPQPLPLEWSVPPQPERVKKWTEESGGKVLALDELREWLNGLSWAHLVSVPSSQPLSTLPLPYLLLLLALTVEWWLLRRSGLS